MIPKEAKLVYRGRLFEVYNWEQEQFDGTFKTYEQLRRRSSVTILPITADNKIMLCEEEQPARGKFLSTPGGQIDDGEKPEAAAVRELLEETGYEGKLKFWMETHPYRNKIDWTVHNYIAHDIRKISDQKLDAGERVRPFFVDFDEFIDVVLNNDDFRNVELTLAVINAMRKHDGIEQLKKLFF